MRDNPPPADPRLFALPGHRIMAMEGRDASAFAHAQFMNDVAALPDGLWQWNGWLTPKGRVIALFSLLKFDPQTLWLVLPDAAPAQLAEALRRFVFRSKVALSVREDLHAAGRFAFPSTASGARIAGDGSDVELDFGTAASPRGMRISMVPADADERLADRWTAFDLDHGLPRLPESQSGQWTPQQLSLERLHAYSVRKGCYPGQEIVARTHFLGQAKRGLALFDADSAPVAGDDVIDANRSLGTVVSVASHDREHLALAVLPMEREGTRLQARGIVLRERPILEGLAR